MTRRTVQDEPGAMTVLQITGAITHGAALDRVSAQPAVEVPAEKVETGETIYRVASTPRGLGLRRGDLLVVEPRDNHAATAELVIAALGERLFLGRWWGKHGRRVVMDATLTPLIEDASLRVLGAVTVVMRILDLARGKPMRRRLPRGEVPSGND